jgi:hypothetical protein
VKLIPRADLPANWAPINERDVTVWEVTQHLVKLLTSSGEGAAANLLRKCWTWADAARDLAQWQAATSLGRHPKEALDYDALVTSWSELVRLAERQPGAAQGTLTPAETVDG